MGITSYLQESTDDDDVYLRRELLLTMMVIRIAMMTTVFMGRHTNKLERLRLREGLPSYARVHTYLAGLYSIINPLDVC